jgi:hypothetical protein
MVGPLAKINGKTKFGIKWFSHLVDRVEEIRPTPGKHIIIEPTLSGCKVSLNAKIYSINVCNNGSPDTIYLYGVQSAATDLQGDAIPGAFANIA